MAAIQNRKQSIMKKYLEAIEGGGGIDWQKLCAEKEKRVRELEEALRDIKKWSANFHPSITQDIHKRAKNVLNRH